MIAAPDQLPPGAFGGQLFNGTEDNFRNIVQMMGSDPLQLSLYLDGFDQRFVSAVGTGG